jgi:hypothetical protein
MTNRYAVEIGDLDIDGPELSDEELRATRGGWYIGWDSCSCLVGGGYDLDNPEFDWNLP